MLYQMSLVAAIAAEIDRQLPGAVANGDAMNAIIAAADAIVAAHAGITVPDARPMKGSWTPVARSEEAELVALDTIPGWEAA